MRRELVSLSVAGEIITFKTGYLRPSEQDPSLFTIRLKGVGQSFSDLFALFGSPQHATIVTKDNETFHGYVKTIHLEDGANGEAALEGLFTPR